MSPLSDYADPRPGLSYGSYVAAARRSGHLAIGYCSTGVGTADLSDAIHLDPPKSATVDLQPHDRLIIVATRDAPSPTVQPRASAPQLEGTSA